MNKKTMNVQKKHHKKTKKIKAKRRALFAAKKQPA